MVKKELIKAMSEKAEMNQKGTEKVLKAFEEVVLKELAKGGKVQLVGFGTFDTIEVKGRTGQSALTGKEWTSEDHQKPRFKASKVLKDAVKGK